MVLSPRSRVRLLKGVVWALCLLPLGLGVHRAVLGDGFGVNPVEAMEHFTGQVALIVLLAVLAVTPIRRLTGWNAVQKVRRLVGLFAFFWVSLHFLVWIGLDQFFEWRYVGDDIANRPYILVGTLAFLLLIPLAVTSTRGWIRRLGRNWARLHRLVYVAALLGIVHFFWVTRADDRWPVRALVVWALLMALRTPWARLLGRRRGRRRGGAGAASGADSGDLASLGAGGEPR